MKIKNKIIPTIIITSIFAIAASLIIPNYTFTEYKNILTIEDVDNFNCQENSAINIEIEDKNYIIKQNIYIENKNIEFNVQKDKINILSLFKDRCLTNNNCGRLFFFNQLEEKTLFSSIYKQKCSIDFILTSLFLEFKKEYKLKLSNNPEHALKSVEKIDKSKINLLYLTDINPNKYSHFLIEIDRISEVANFYFINNNTKEKIEDIEFNINNILDRHRL